MKKRILSLLMAGILAIGTAMAEESGIEEAIRQETSRDWEVTSSIPSKYLVKCAEPGTVEEIHYDTKDYFGDGSDRTKRAFVYLPYGYDENEQYDVLILCHGIGGSEYEWELNRNTSRLKAMMDNMIYYKEIKPFILVTPNGRAGNTTDFNAFYLFGQEIRNDLLPYIDANYSTYGTREHRGMAGLSMGGMQTINIGMCECLDLFGWFGAFSACPTTYTASQIAAKLKTAPEDQPIYYFYNICGTTDDIAYASASAAAKNILGLTDKLTEDNYQWQEQLGGHTFTIWHLGFFNFAHIFAPYEAPAVQ